MGNILKVSCYRNYCIDFNQIWHNDRDHHVVIVGGPTRYPTNPKWRTAAILKNVKSPYLCDRSADFDEIWQDGTYWPKFMSDWNLFGGRPGLGIFGELGVQLTLLHGAGGINRVGKNLVGESILKMHGLVGHNSE